MITSLYQNKNDLFRTNFEETVRGIFFYIPERIWRVLTIVCHQVKTFNLQENLKLNMEIYNEQRESEKIKSDTS